MQPGQKREKSSSALKHCA